MKGQKNEMNGTGKYPYLSKEEEITKELQAINLRAIFVAIPEHIIKVSVFKII